MEERKETRWDPKKICEVLGLERTTPNYIVMEERKLTTMKEKVLKKNIKIRRRDKEIRKEVSERVSGREGEKVGRRKERKIAR